MTVDELLADDDTLARFLAWQPSLTAAAMWCRDSLSGYVDDGVPMSVIKERFGPGGAYPIDWDALGMDHMIDGAARYDGFDEDSEDWGAAHAKGIVRRTLREVTAILKNEILAPYVESFEFSEQASAPEAQVIDLAQVDWATVTSWNEAIMKDLEPGQSVAFWQAGDQIILGDTQSAAWRMAIERANGYDPPTGDNLSGWVTMQAKGGLGSSGKVSVTGNYDQSGFKTALRRFSNKSVEFA